MSGKVMEKNKNKTERWKKGTQKQSIGIVGRIWPPSGDVVTGWVGSPVRLGVVCAQLLPEDSVSPWRGQKAALSLRPTSQLHFLNLNGHLYKQSTLIFIADHF